MKTTDLVSTAAANTFRSKTRTILTVLAIFVGAFTLTLTNGLGTGINRFIDDTVSGIGASDVLTVTKATGGGAASTGPQKYDPESITSGNTDPGRPGATTEVSALTDADISAIAQLPGVERVVPTKAVKIDFVQVDGGDRYVASAGSLIGGQTPQLAAGSVPDDAATVLQTAIPQSLVTPLGFASDGDAIGATLTIAVSDPVRTQHLVEAG